MDVIYGIEHIKHRAETTHQSSSSVIYNKFYYELILIQYLIIVLSGLCVRYYYGDGIYFVLLIIVMPILMVTHSTWNHIASKKSYSDLVKQLNEEIESEQTPNIIPILLFSLSIVVQYTHPKLLHMMVTYMLWAIIFGTIIPHILKQNIFDYNDLRRLVIFSELEFTFISIAIGYIVLSLSILLASK